MTFKANKMGLVLLSAGLLLVANTVMVTSGQWHKIASWNPQQPLGSTTVESPPVDTPSVSPLSARLG